MAEPKIEKSLYFLLEESYHGSHDFFYSSQKFPSVQVLENNWEIIRDEILGTITDKEISELENLNPPYLSSPDAWKNIYLYNFGWKKHKNCDRFPKTHALLKQVPNLIFGGITVLEPKSKVLPHNGETNTIIRCHLGLKIPAAHPICGVRVGDQEEGWENGKVTMFSDAHYHSTWNDSDERRYVLVFDIVRDEYANKKHTVCANVLGALTLKYLYSKNQNIKKIPYIFIKSFHLMFTSFWYMYLPLQNKFRLP